MKKEEKATVFIDKVIELSNEYGLNCFVVTDGRSGTNNRGNKVIKHIAKYFNDYLKNHGIQ